MARTVYGNRWRVEASLGEGGQAHTFKVIDTSGEVPGMSVLKRLKNASRLGRFEREIRALEILECPRIPKVLDWRLDTERFVVTPFLGEPLTGFLLKHGGSSDLALAVGEQVAEALVAAHSVGIAHRDVKPDNIVIRAAANGGIEVFLIDFGICQWDESGIFSTAVDEAFGNAAFAAPECSLGSPTKDGLPADVYSLGKVMYWVGTGGAHLFREDVSDEAIGKLVQRRGVETAHIERLLSSMLTESPDARPTAAIVLERIREARRMADEGVSPVGSKHQLCLACRSGYLRREQNMHNMGYANVSPHLQRILRCPSCGFIQHYYIENTLGEKYWEI